MSLRHTVNPYRRGNIVRLRKDSYTRVHNLQFIKPGDCGRVTGFDTDDCTLVRVLFDGCRTAIKLHVLEVNFA